jgi:sec-independent protein translocase protein TatA
MKALGASEILVIVLVLLVLFGGRKIPELAKGLGEGIRHFKDSFKSGTDSNDEKKDV